jgi:hypothetical protein
LRGVNLMFFAAIAAAWGTCAGAQTQSTLEQDAVAFDNAAQGGPAAGRSVIRGGVSVP